MKLKSVNRNEPLGMIPRLYQFITKIRVLLNAP